MCDASLCRATGVLFSLVGDPACAGGDNLLHKAWRGTYWNEKAYRIYVQNWVECHLADAEAKKPQEPMTIAILSVRVLNLRDNKPDR